MPYKFNPLTGNLDFYKTQDISVLNIIKDKYVRTTRFAIISSGTSGSVILPSNSTVVLDDFGGTTDAILSTVTSGRPNYTTPKTGGGTMVATSFNNLGNYTLTGVPSSYPIAILYRVQQKLEDFDSSSSDIVITNEQVQLDSHINNTSNPHSVTKAQLSLGNVDNTSDANKPISDDTQDALDLKADLNEENTFTENNQFAALTGFGNVSSPQAVGHFGSVSASSPNPGALTATFRLGTSGYTHGLGDKSYSVRTTKDVGGTTIYSTSDSDVTGVEKTDINPSSLSANIFGYGASAPNGPLTNIENTGSGAYLANGQTINYQIVAYKDISGTKYYSDAISTSYTDVINDGTTTFDIRVSWNDASFFDGYKVYVQESGASYDVVGTNNVLDNLTATGDTDIAKVLSYTANGSNRSYEVWALYYGGACVSVSSASASSGSDANNGGTYRVDLSWSAPSDYGTADLYGYRVINTTDNTSFDVVGGATSVSDNGAWGGSAGSSPTVLTFFELSLDPVDEAGGYQFYNNSNSTEQHEGSPASTDIGTWSSGTTITPTSVTYPSLITKGRTEIAKDGTTELVGFFGADPVDQPANTEDLVAGLASLGLRAGSSISVPCNLGSGTVTCGIIGAITIIVSSGATVNGVLSSPSSSTNTTTGTINNLSTNGISSINFNGASAQTVTGFANPGNGKFLFITNIAATGLVLKHQDSNSTTANQIYTPSAGDYTIPAKSFAILQYNSLSSRWFVMAGL